jgi:serine protease Do
MILSRSKRLCFLILVHAAALHGAGDSRAENGGPETVAPELEEAFGLKPEAATDPKESENGGVEALAERVRPSLVIVSHFGRDGTVNGTGSGFVISEDGLIATCKHVIGEARDINIELSDGTVHPVTAVHAWDGPLDLAIVRIDAKGLQPLPLGDSDSLRQGMPVVAMGNPHGLEFSVVRGVVSAIRDVKEDGIAMIQLAIPIEPGNSGSPLLDLEGRVHGILSMKSTVTENLGFAMPVNALKPLIEKPNSVPMDKWLTIGALNPREWTPLFGATWKQRAGHILVDQVGDGFGGRSLCVSSREVPAEPYEVAVSVKMEDESGAAGLIFASDGADKHYGFYPSAGQLRLTRFEGGDVFNWTVLEQFQSAAYRPGEWNQLRVRVEADKIIGFVNGEKVVECEDAVLRGGKVGLAKFRETKAEFKRFRVGADLETEKPAPDLAAALEEALKDLRVPDEKLDPLAANVDATAAFLAARTRALEVQLEEIRELRQRVDQRSVEAELIRVLDVPETEIDLARAALAIARLDNPEVDTEGYLREIERMAIEVVEGFASNSDTSGKLETLGRYLFEQNGYHGSRDDYYNRSNSYLNEVIDDREGIPITLSVLYLELARRAGIEGTHGLGLPGHFIVCHGEGAERRYIDVFEAGRYLAENEVAEIAVRGGGELKDFPVAGAREMVVRMLTNLKGVAIEEERYAEALRYAGIIIALMPDDGNERLSRALLYVQSSQGALAKPDLEWIFEHKPEGIYLDRLRSLYEQL